MSMNLVVTDFNDEGEGPTLVLHKFNKGITSSAQIRSGDWIKFEDTTIQACIVEITHRWERSDSSIAPNSIVRAVIDHEMTDEEWDTLRELGFKDKT